MNKTRISCILIFTLLAAVNYGIGIGQCVPGNGIANAPYSPNVPNIDGEWSTPTEWIDGNELRVENQFGWVAYFLIKTNQTHLFVLLDFIDDLSEAIDIGGVCIDTNDDGGNFPKNDDYIFGVQPGFPQSHVFKGTGEGGLPENAWTEISIPAGCVFQVKFSSKNDPYESGKSHRIYEFAIPCAFLGESVRYGFYAFAFDVDSVTLLEWPLGANGNALGSFYRIPPAPGNWGSIGGDFVSELSWIVVLPLFMASTLLVAVACKKRQQRSIDKFIGSKQAHAACLIRQMLLSMPFAAPPSRCVTT